MQITRKKIKKDKISSKLYFGKITKGKSILWSVIKRLKNEK